jgi:hypothetical protein
LRTWRRPVNLPRIAAVSAEARSVRDAGTPLGDHNGETRPMQTLPPPLARDEELDEDDLEDGWPGDEDEDDDDLDDLFDDDDDEDDDDFDDEDDEDLDDEEADDDF